jgi:hypothetical protein
MKKFLFSIVFLAAVTACVPPEVAVSYAQRAHPECTEFKKMNHSFGSGKDGASLTEVAMKCGDARKSITVKCHYGMGCVSDTTCYENN